MGQRVFRSGSTSGLHDGEVTGLDATVNHPEGTVTGLIRTTACAEPGDSGGPLFSEGTALGTTSGGSGGRDRTAYRRRYSATWNRPGHGGTPSAGGGRRSADRGESGAGGTGSRR